MTANFKGEFDKGNSSSPMKPVTSVDMYSCLNILTGIVFFITEFQYQMFSIFSKLESNSI